jgi:hypothetical protein
MKGKNQYTLTFIAPVLTLAFTAVMILIRNWGRCGSLIVDTFRDPVIADKIVSGQVLYRDIFYEYGFFPPYFLAGLEKIFGLRIDLFMTIGAITFLAAGGLVYFIARRFLNPWLAVLPTLAFALAFAIKEYYPEDVFTYLFPYSFATLFVSLAALTALAAFLAIRDKAVSRAWFIWMISMYMAFLCRVETAFLCWLGFFFLAKDKKEKRLFIPLLAAALSYGLFLFLTQSSKDFFTSNFTHILVALGGKACWNHLSGGLTLGQDLWLMTKVFGEQLILTGVAAVAASLWTGDAKRKGLSMILAMLGVWLACQISLVDFYRSLPLALAMVIIFSGKNGREKIILCVMGIIFAIRTILATTVVGLGFCFLSVGIIGFYIFFFALVPGFWEKKLKLINMKIFFTLITVFFVASHLSGLGLCEHWRGARTVRVNTPLGAIYCFPTEATIYFWQAVGYLKQKTVPQTTVTVLPEGSGINFFSQRNNRFKYHAVLPPTLSMIREDEIIAALEKSRTDYIVITSRDTSEYGGARFGGDYAQKVQEWIARHYVLEKVFGPYPFTAPESGIALWRRGIHGR